MCAKRRDGDLTIISGLEYRFQNLLMELVNGSMKGCILLKFYYVLKNTRSTKDLEATILFPYIFPLVGFLNKITIRWPEMPNVIVL